MNIYLIIGSVVATGISQILFKIGMKDFTFEGLGSFLLYVIKNPYLLVGIVIMALGMFSRFFVLSKNEVSFAYPFTVISYLIVTVGGRYLGETINIQKILGIAVIIGGLILIIKS